MDVPAEGTKDWAAAPRRLHNFVRGRSAVPQVTLATAGSSFDRALAIPLTAKSGLGPWPSDCFVWGAAAGADGKSGAEQQTTTGAATCARETIATVRNSNSIAKRCSMTLTRSGAAFSRAPSWRAGGAAALTAGGGFVAPAVAQTVAARQGRPGHHYLPATAETVHWGYFSKMPQAAARGRSPATSSPSRP